MLREVIRATPVTGSSLHLGDPRRKRSSVIMRARRIVKRYDWKNIAKLPTARIMLVATDIEDFERDGILYTDLKRHLQMVCFIVSCYLSAKNIRLDILFA